LTTIEFHGLMMKPEDRHWHSMMEYRIIREQLYSENNQKYHNLRPFGMHSCGMFKDKNVSKNVFTIIRALLSLRRSPQSG
jgi:hypothetical protein